MFKRRKMSPRKSKSNFKRGHKTPKRNLRAKPLRGGYRL